MSIDRRRLLVTALLAGLAPIAPIAPIADAAERRERFATSELTVTGLVGRLRVVGEDRTDMQVTLRGEGLDAVRVERRGDTLHLDGAATGLSLGSVTVGQNLVVASRGGRATSRIGGSGGSVIGNGQVIVGRATGAAHGASHVDALVRVPRGAALAIAAMAGEVDLATVQGPVELELVSGSARIDQMAGGRLRITGSGEIAVRHASGDLVVSVAGSGDVRVADAMLGGLDVDLAGTGNVVIDGVAERARLRVAGIGDVRVREVRARPMVSVAGLGQVDVGNW